MNRIHNYNGEQLILIVLAIMLIITSVIFSAFITKNDKIIKETKDSVYVMHYTYGNKDSTITPFHKPQTIYAKCIDKNNIYTRFYFQTLKSKRKIEVAVNEKQYENFEKQYKNKIFKLKYIYYPKKDKGYHLIENNKK